VKPRATNGNERPHNESVSLGHLHLICLVSAITVTVQEASAKYTTQLLQGGVLILRTYPTAAQLSTLVRCARVHEVDPVRALNTQPRWQTFKAQVKSAPWLSFDGDTRSFPEECKAGRAPLRTDNKQTGDRSAILITKMRPALHASVVAIRGDRSCRQRGHIRIAYQANHRRDTNSKRSPGTSD
jgi:hypothetical protein